MLRSGSFHWTCGRWPRRGSPTPGLPPSTPEADQRNGTFGWGALPACELPTTTAPPGDAAKATLSDEKAVGWPGSASVPPAGVQRNACSPPAVVYWPTTVPPSGEIPWEKLSPA